MAHPKATRRSNGRLWHLEDSKLTAVEARALAKHLRNTEDKKARIHKAKEGHEVWWAKR